MARMIDWRCACGRVQQDCLEAVDASRECPDCHAQMEQDWLPRVRGDAQWDDNTAVLVLVNDDPSCPRDVRVRYPGQHSARVPDGYRRVHLRSLAEVGRFEREHQVACHAMHFDRNGRALDDKMVGNH